MQQQLRCAIPVDNKHRQKKVFFFFFFFFFVFVLRKAPDGSDAVPLKGVIRKTGAMLLMFGLFAPNVPEALYHSLQVKYH